jgi:hypothetical protein
MIYEPAISPERIHGKNLEFINTNIPHIWKLLTTDLDAMIRRSDVVVLVKKLNEQERLVFRASPAQQPPIDFVGTLRPEDLPAEIPFFAKPEPTWPSAAAAIPGQE